MTVASANIFPKVTVVEGAAPASPAATNFSLYFDSADHLLKWKNSAGTVTTVSTGSIVSVTASEIFMTADTNITPANTYVDLLTQSLAAGTYCFWGAAVVQNGAATNMTLELIDSAAVVYHTIEGRCTGAGIEVPLNVHAANVVFGSTTTIKLRAATGNVTGTCNALGSGTGQNLVTNKTTKLSWIKIA